MNKPIVLYDITKEHKIEIGQRAFVCPINHPNTDRVSNTHLARTTVVLNYNEHTGSFETLNSIYRPYSQCQVDSIELLPKSLTNDNDY